MVFKIIEKGQHAMAHAPMTIAITASGFSFGSDVVKFIGDNSSLEVYLDKDNKRVGFKPTNNILTGFKLHKGGKSWTMSGSNISKRLTAGKYTAKIEDGFAVITVKEIGYN